MRYMDKSIHRRRWYQFSLRSLLIFTAVVAVFIGWLAAKVERKAADRETVEAIVKAGGRAYYDYQQGRDGNVIAWMLYAEPTGPAWLRKILGENFFSEVDFVWLNGLDFADADLERIKRLTQLEFLSLRRTKVSDGGLAEIRGLAKLRFLDVGETKVTDAGLQYIEDLTQLNELDLTGIKVTDNGLAQLNRLANLKYLYLTGTLVTDAGIEHLQRLLPKCMIVSGGRLSRP
jgi:hypothetical protein